MKNGILNFPEITTDLSDFIVGPSNGNAPQTNTYKTTPKLCVIILKNKLENFFLGKLFFFSII